MASSERTDFEHAHGERRGTGARDRPVGHEHTSLGWILAIAVAIGLALVAAVLIVRLTENDDSDLAFERPMATATTTAAGYDIELTPGPEGVVVLGTTTPDSGPDGTAPAPLAEPDTGTRIIG